MVELRGQSSDPSRWKAQAKRELRNYKVGVGFPLVPYTGVSLNSYRVPVWRDLRCQF